MLWVSVRRVIGTLALATLGGAVDVGEADGASVAAAAEKRDMEATPRAPRAAQYAATNRRASRWWRAGASRRGTAR